MKQNEQKSSLFSNYIRSISISISNPNLVDSPIPRMDFFKILVGFLLFPLLLSSVSCKVCTNEGLSSYSSLSHSSRYESFRSKNTSFKEQNLSHLHLVTDDDDHLDSIIPRRMLMEADESSSKFLDTEKPYHRKFGLGRDNGFLKGIPLHDVRLDPNSIHGVAQQTNLDYLLMLDVDRLVWSFRKTAGIETIGEPYGGWEGSDVELRGHFVGHYLSATAQMWASTHNPAIKEKMSLLVSVLSVCQNKIGNGYLSAFPSEFFDRFEALQEVWAPYYTIHKILAGLLDQYTLAGNDQALNMTIWMVDYFHTRVQNVISNHTIERHWLSLNEETGGMNDVLYKLYSITHDQKHFLLAHLFDKPCFLGLLALKADDISGFHANTHIPIVIGAQKRYEITRDPLYKEIGEYFMDIVNSSHSYATGGTSVGEFWSDPNRLASTLETENQESCTTYNMLKVSRYLFQWTKEVSFADYYERALTNGVLGIQRGRDPGVMIYMLPLLPGGSKAHSYHGWGKRFDSFWCCYGTGIESFSKLGDSIYFEEEEKYLSFYIVQYINSSVDWKSGKISLNQTVEPVNSWDQRLKVTVTITSNKEEYFSLPSLNLRIPGWTNGANASFNGERLCVPPPGNFMSVSSSQWSPGDKIILHLPLSIRTEAIKDDRPEYASVQAFLYGPYLLAGFSTGDWDIKLAPNTSLPDYITPIPAEYNSYLITLSQESGNSTFSLSNSDRIIKMENYPEPGTNSAVKSTFRLVVKNPKSKAFREAKDVIGESVMLEPFDFPGMLLHNGEGENLEVSSSVSDSKNQSFSFHLVSGLDGKNNTVSFESEIKKGCYIYSGSVHDSGSSVNLNCSSGSSDLGFGQATSFVMGDGISKYDPISFVAKGAERNFVLAPLLSLIDESYTIYFNITA